MSFHIKKQTQHFVKQMFPASGERMGRHPPKQA